MRKLVRLRIRRWEPVQRVLLMLFALAIVPGIVFSVADEFSDPWIKYGPVYVGQRYVSVPANIKLLKRRMGGDLQEYYSVDAFDHGTRIFYSTACRSREDGSQAQFAADTIDSQLNTQLGTQLSLKTFPTLKETHERAALVKKRNTLRNSALEAQSIAPDLSDSKCILASFAPYQDVVADQWMLKWSSLTSTILLIAAGFSALLILAWPLERYVARFARRTIRWVRSGRF